MMHCVSDNILSRFGIKCLLYTCYACFLSILLSYYFQVSIINILMASVTFIYSQILMKSIFVNFINDTCDFYNFLLNDYQYFDIPCFHTFLIWIIIVYNLRSKYMFMLVPLNLIFNIFAEYITKIICAMCE
jgi:hypothetical protein